MILPLTDLDRLQLLANGHTSQRDPNFDPPPVVKLFMPDGSGTWLLTELDPEEPDRAFDLCDLGHGSPELGYILLTELVTVRGRLCLSIERDAYFGPEKPLSRHRGRLPPRAGSLPDHRLLKAITHRADTVTAPAHHATRGSATPTTTSHNSREIAHGQVFENMKQWTKCCCRHPPFIATSEL